jgi:hypothetical protein
LIDGECWFKTRDTQRCSCVCESAASGFESTATYRVILLVVEVHLEQLLHNKLSLPFVSNLTEQPALLVNLFSHERIRMQHARTQANNRQERTQQQQVHNATQDKRNWCPSSNNRPKVRDLLFFIPRFGVTCNLFASLTSIPLLSHSVVVVFLLSLSLSLRYNRWELVVVVLGVGVNDDNGDISDILVWNCAQE